MKTILNLWFVQLYWTGMPKGKDWSSGYRWHFGFGCLPWLTEFRFELGRGSLSGERLPKACRAKEARVFWTGASR